MFSCGFGTVKGVDLTQVRDEVASDLREREGAGVHMDENEARGRQMGVDFHLLTDSVTSNIIPNENRPPWLPVAALDKLESLQMAQMTCSG